MPYDDHGYGTVQTVQVTAVNQTSVRAATVAVAAHTFMSAVTVTDFNISWLGDVAGAALALTGTQDSNRLILGIGKSVAGTGTITQLGTCVLGTAALGSVIDGTCAATNFDAGDDLVLTANAGTALVALQWNATANVKYKERFV